MRFLLSGGNQNDICMAQELLEPFDLTGKLILADRGYDSAKFIRWVEERGCIDCLHPPLATLIVSKHTLEVVILI